VLLAFRVSHRCPYDDVEVECIVEGDVAYAARVDAPRATLQSVDDLHCAHLGCACRGHVCV